METHNIVYGIPDTKIAGTSFDNTPEGVAALLRGHRHDVLSRERTRVEGNERRAGGDYGEELGQADEALRLINSLRYPSQLIDAAEAAVTDNNTALDSVPDHLDALVEALAVYAQDLTIQTQNLDWTSKTIRNGVEPDNDTPR